MKFSFLLRPPRFACARLTLTTGRSLVYELEQGGIRDEIYTFTAHAVNSSDYQGKAHLFSHFRGTLEAKPCYSSGSGHPPPETYS